MNYIKKLNWFGFTMILLLCMVGGLFNDSIVNVKSYILLITFVGLPMALLFLFLGKKD